MSVSIIIRKKGSFQSPVKLAVVKINKYAWKKYAHKRKRTLLQKLRTLLRHALVKRQLHRIEHQIAMF